MHACNGYRLIQLCNIYIYIYACIFGQGKGMAWQKTQWEVQVAIACIGIGQVREKTMCRKKWCMNDKWQETSKVYRQNKIKKKAIFLSSFITPKTHTHTLKSEKSLKNKENKEKRKKVVDQALLIRPSQVYFLCTLAILR